VQSTSGSKAKEDLAAAMRAIQVLYPQLTSASGLAVKGIPVQS